MSELLLGAAHDIPLLLNSCPPGLQCGVSHEEVTVADRLAPCPQRDGSARCQALEDTGMVDALRWRGAGGSGSEPCSWHGL